MEVARRCGVHALSVSARLGSPLHPWREGGRISLRLHRRVSGADDRYGTDIGLAVDSVLVGLSGSPVTYYSTTPLLISAETGTFGGGIIRIAIHFLELTPPRPV